MYADKILINGRIYTENKDMMWAEAVAVKGSRFICVGKNEECMKYRGDSTQVVELEGKTVIPALIDGHTHPVTVAKTYWHVRMPLTHDREQLLENIKEYAAKHPKEECPYFYGESYFAETFGTEGPKKEILDEIISDRPARIQDFTDHACWYNSIALEMLDGKAGSPKGEAEFIKDENGEYTGWALEAGPDTDFGVYSALGWNPPQGTEEESVAPFLDFLKSKGIVCLMDGFTENEESIKMFYEMDKAGRLNMFYEGTSIMGQYENLDEAIERVYDWQKKYTSEHVHINTVKFFMDGTNEMGDSASLEPMKNDPSGKNFGTANITEEQLTDVLVRLNREGIDMHIHVVCDRGFRICCNAVENARKICGDEWKIYVTLAHCELIHPDDMKRVAELGIFIDWTTHWSGGYFGTAAIEYLGRERWNTMYDFTKIIADGGTVGFSSDLFSYQEAHRGDPYFGIQTAMTRKDILMPLDPDEIPGSIRPPETAKLSLEQLLRGYTCNNAFRMRMIDKMGTIEAGKLANLIVLNKDIFSLEADQIHTVRPDMVLFEGREQELKEISF